MQMYDDSSSRLNEGAQMKLIGAASRTSSYQASDTLAIVSRSSVERDTWSPSASMSKRASPSWVYVSVYRRCLRAPTRM